MATSLRNVRSVVDETVATVNANAALLEALRAAVVEIRKNQKASQVEIAALQSDVARLARSAIRKPWA